MYSTLSCTKKNVGYKLMKVRMTMRTRMRLRMRLKLRLRLRIKMMLRLRMRLRMRMRIRVRARVRVKMMLRLRRLRVRLRVRMRMKMKIKMRMRMQDEVQDEDDPKDFHNISKMAGRRATVFLKKLNRHPQHFTSGIVQLLILNPWPLMLFLHNCKTRWPIGPKLWPFSAAANEALVDTSKSAGKESVTPRGPT